jgi:hypothetical protein
MRLERRALLRTGPDGEHRFDGRSLLWLGRRKVTGRGEGSTGLRFDRLTR